MIYSIRIPPKKKFKFEPWPKNHFWIITMIISVFSGKLNPINAFTHVITSILYVFKLLTTSGKYPALLCSYVSLCVLKLAMNVQQFNATLNSQKWWNWQNVRNAFLLSFADFKSITFTIHKNSFEQNELNWWLMSDG